MLKSAHSLNILCSEWRNLQLQKDPYDWTLVEPGSLIDEQVADELARTFPTEGMHRIDKGQRAGGKRYRNFSLPVGADDDLRGFSPEWQALLRDLRSDRYLQNMSELLNIPHAGRVELRFVRHGPQDWLDPHTDDPAKLFTQVFYFNANWDADDGGSFDVLRSPNPLDVAARVAPLLGTSVIIAPSERSWHQVTAVKTDKPRARQSLVVHGER